MATTTFFPDEKVVASWTSGDDQKIKMVGTVVSGNDDAGYRVNVSMGINILFQKDELTLVGD